MNVIMKNLDVLCQVIIRVEIKWCQRKQSVVKTISSGYTNMIVTKTFVIITNYKIHPQGEIQMKYIYVQGKSSLDRSRLITLCLYITFIIFLIVACII